MTWGTEQSGPRGEGLGCPETEKPQGKHKETKRKLTVTTAMEINEPVITGQTESLELVPGALREVGSSEVGVAKTVPLVGRGLC